MNKKVTTKKSNKIEIYTCTQLFNIISEQTSAQIMTITVTHYI